MEEYLQSDEYKPGTWKKLGKKATFVCPRCKRIGSLEDHDIANDGVVKPSLVCPYGCGFHEFIKLLGWEE